MARKRKRLQDDHERKNSLQEPTADPNVPHGVTCLASIGDVPYDAQHYWRQRYQIFSRYDEGIWMTDDAWFGVTQESVARKIAEHVAAMAPSDKSIIIDVFCGVGGNAIAFALSGRWKRVYAIEKDPLTLDCARHNAQVYGVADKITWFQGDCFEILGTEDQPQENAVDALKIIIGEYGVIFASPPWGGPGYKGQAVFDLTAMQPYHLDFMHSRLRKVTKNMALYLPRTSDVRQLAECAESGSPVQVVHYCTHGGSRALCAYLGDWLQLDQCN